MKKTYLLTGIISIILIISLILVVKFILKPRGWKAKLTTPMGSSFNQTTPVPSSTLLPVSTPQTFKFDGSTDLKKELDSINPQVLDSDFE